MLDPAFIRDHIETVRQRLSARGVDFAEELEQFATLEAQRRQTIPALEGLKREQNAAGDEVARAKLKRRVFPPTPESLKNSRAPFFDSQSSAAPAP